MCVCVCVCVCVYIKERASDAWIVCIMRFVLLCCARGLPDSDVNDFMKMFVFLSSVFAFLFVCSLVYLVGRSVGPFVRSFVSWLACYMVGWLVGWLVG